MVGFLARAWPHHDLFVTGLISHTHMLHATPVAAAGSVSRRRWRRRGWRAACGCD